MPMSRTYIHRILEKQSSASPPGRRQRDKVAPETKRPQEGVANGLIVVDDKHVA